MYIEYKTPPYLNVGETGGRPKVDFEALHAEWLKSNIEDLDLFLALYKMDRDKVTVARATHGWSRDKPYEAPPVTVVYKAKRTTKERSNLRRLTPVSAVTTGQRDAEPDLDKQISQIWGMITKWRSKQFQEDYTLADKLRIAIDESVEHILQAGVGSKFIKSSDILSLARALEVVQKIQRLSLGMSTENIGIKSPREMAEEAAFAANAAKKAEESPGEEDVPTFEVAVNEQGKFKRLKPRQIK